MKKTLLIALLTMFAVAAASGQSYAFDNVDPATAYAMAASDSHVYILDVRTAEEWQWVGHPGQNKLGEGAALTGKVVNISYEINHKGALIVNPSFLTDVAEIFKRNSGVTLITMCRSGSRSLRAAEALEGMGYRALNMVTGFEGGTDAKGYRTVNGWKVLDLPYTYSGAKYAD